MKDLKISEAVPIKRTTLLRGREGGTKKKNPHTLTHKFKP